ncbi:vegetative incompatibility protein het-e-1 [Fusarium langsethiae]|uniref:Vegetative incompatibility protein het-e-1 n=1 Tax=Fusarium langsethiae TaxID=179993 RepID=A0A0N0DCN4_FUSLA|nr:vegetative incompatibility protein het-e-1 [Fusarium langsethiae]GKU08944.1 unnamed protein product [Fusarium langsethiae]GKU15114.1 unnamed protein product [Fusarium langsethiae]
MSKRGTSSWRSRLGCHELRCGAFGNATAPAQDSESVPTRVSAVPQGRASVSLPLDQVSRRTETTENAAPVLRPQPQDEPEIQSTIIFQTIPIDPSASDNDDTLRKHQEELRPLWKEAIQKVEDSRDGGKLNEVLQNQKQINTGDSKVELTNLLSELEGEMERVGLKGKMADAIGKVVPHLNRIAIVGDVAVSANPNPAALPWAVVRFLLLSITASEDIRAKIVESIAEIVILVFECSVYQELYLTAEAAKSLSTAKGLRKVVVQALSQCIRFLALALCQQRAVAKALTDAFRLEDFSGYLKDLQKAKLQLHDAGVLCEMYHHSQDRDLLKDLHKLILDMRHGSKQRLEREAKSKLKDLLLDPKDAIDHIYHPDNSYCLEGTRQTVL